MAYVVVAIVGISLVVGAVWGVRFPPSDDVEGFVVALAGGALLVSAMSELIEPAIDRASIVPVGAAVLVGAAVFSGIDRLVDERWGGDSGGGLLAAITLDGIPENLALGVVLISSGPLEVAAIAGSIILSNLPEAAGGAKGMTGSGRDSRAILGLWTVTAIVLSASAVVGKVALASASEVTLSLIQSFAAGAVIASLATEVFPKAFHEDRQVAGLAAAAGTVLALALGQLG
ncbi:MAG: zinc transporter [Ilumatobacteraceae bacterium]